MTCAEIFDRFYGGLTSSARLKFCRGAEQVKALCRDTGAFENGDLCSTRVERNRTSPYEIEGRCYAALRKPIDPDWSLRAGEAVQNLRSSLDHAIYASAKRPNSRTQFPIFTDECEFKVLGRKNIERVPEAKWAFIESAQPYKRTKSEPQWDPLELLRVLSNRDKHRSLATVAAAVRQEWVGIPDGTEVAWKRYATNTVVGEAETEISVFVATYAAEAEQVDVQPGFAFGVLLESMDIAILKTIALRTFEVLIEFETGTAPNPFGYPVLF